MLKKILFGGESGLSHAANLGLTILRVFAGSSLAFAHGVGKVPPSDNLVARIADLGFPVPALFAWAAAMSEFLGGIFLAIGLFTRVAGFFISFTMAVAILGVHAADPYQRKELAAMYMVVAAAFMFKGAGDWSIDGFLRK